MEKMSLDLAELLSDPIIRDCYLWKEVGLELGIQKSKLDVIAKDHPNQTEECKMEMLDTWLKNDEKASSEDLHQAIKRVNERHMRVEHRRCTKDEEKRALDAVNYVKVLLKQWEERNKEIAADHKGFQEELEREKQWLSIASEWREDNDEWQQGEDAITRANIERVLQEGGNFKRSSFVKEFIRNRNIQFSFLKNQGVEGLLRQSLMEIDISRSTTLLDRFGKMKRHYRRLQHLQEEIIQSKNLIDERLLAYDKIKQGLEKLGIKQSKLEELNKQLKVLKRTAEDCIKTKDHFDNTVFSRY